MFSITLQLTPSDIEPLYNHVHHAHSLRFLERSRLACLEAVGVPNEGLIARNLFLVITDIQVVYKRELTTGEITVTCENPRIEGKRILLDQKILNPRSKVAIEAVVASAFLSGETRRSIVPPDFFTERFLSFAGPRQS